MKLAYEIIIDFDSQTCKIVIILSQVDYKCEIKALDKEIQQTLVLVM